MGFMIVLLESVKEDAICPVQKEVISGWFPLLPGEPRNHDVTQIADLSRKSAAPIHRRKSEKRPVSINRMVSKITARCPLKAGRACPAVDAAPRAKGRQDACASVRLTAGRAAAGKGMARVHSAAHGPGVTSLTPTGCRCPAAGQILIELHRTHKTSPFTPLRPVWGKHRHHRGFQNTKRRKNTRNLCPNVSSVLCREKST